MSLTWAITSWNTHGWQLHICHVIFGNTVISSCKNCALLMCMQLCSWGLALICRKSCEVSGAPTNISRWESLRTCGKQGAGMCSFQSSVDRNNTLCIMGSALGLPYLWTCVCGAWPSPPCAGISWSWLFCIQCWVGICCGQISALSVQCCLAVLGMHSYLMFCHGTKLIACCFDAVCFQPL